MNIFQTLLLSVIEGVTEFLPISSTGHLILTTNLLKLNQTEFLKSFEIIIQLGAILAVVALYFKRLLVDVKLWIQVFIAFIPAACIGLLFYSIIKNYLLESTVIVAISLFLGGILILLAEYIYKPSKKYDLSNIPILRIFLIGIFQVISMIPGTSRALATIYGGIFLGLNRKSATEFSFLLAIPTMLGAVVYDLYKTDISIWTRNDIYLLAIGLIISFLTALLVVKWLLKYVQTNNFILFGVYRIILATAYFFFF